MVQSEEGCEGGGRDVVGDLYVKKTVGGRQWWG
jgi:hypothetical protein